MTANGNPNRVVWIETQSQYPLCDVPWLGTSIVQSDGSVNFCCFSSGVAGNVNQQSFEEIWNGPIMQRIRHSLIKRQLPTECRSNSCPIFRGDELHYLYDRMEGSYSFKKTGTDDPHAQIRGRLQGSTLSANRSVVRHQDELKINLELHYHGDLVTVDLFVGVMYPDGAIRFLPDFEDYATPFKMAIQLPGNQGLIRFSLFDQRAEALTFSGTLPDLCRSL